VRRHKDPEKSDGWMELTVGKKLSDTHHHYQHWFDGNVPHAADSWGVALFRW
jgi:hypothetical protein